MKKKKICWKCKMIKILMLITNNSLTNKSNSNTKIAKNFIVHLVKIMCLQLIKNYLTIYLLVSL